MPYLYLTMTIFFNASASIICSFYNRKNKDKTNPTPFYNFLLLITIFLCWVILFLFDGTLEWRVVPYAILFSIGFTAAIFSLIQALKTGSVLLTSLILQLSLIGATVWGFFFWNTKFHDSGLRAQAAKEV